MTCDPSRLPCREATMKCKGASMDRDPPRLPCREATMTCDPSRLPCGEATMKCKGASMDRDPPRLPCREALMDRVSALIELRHAQHVPSASSLLRRHHVLQAGQRLLGGVLYATSPRDRCPCRPPRT